MDSSRENRRSNEVEQLHAFLFRKVNLRHSKDKERLVSQTSGTMPWFLILLAIFACQLIFRRAHSHFFRSDTSNLNGCG